LGLGARTNTSSSIPNIIDYQYSRNHLERLSFSICLDINGGVMGVGGFNLDKHLTSDINYVSYSTDT